MSVNAKEIKRLRSMIKGYKAKNQTKGDEFTAGLESVIVSLGKITQEVLQGDPANFYLNEPTRQMSIELLDKNRCFKGARHWYQVLSQNEDVQLQIYEAINIYQMSAAYGESVDSILLKGQTFLADLMSMKLQTDATYDTIDRMKVYLSNETELISNLLRGDSMNPLLCAMSVITRRMINYEKDGGNLEYAKCDVLSTTEIELRIKDWVEAGYGVDFFLQTPLPFMAYSQKILRTVSEARFSNIVESHRLIAMSK